MLVISTGIIHNNISIVEKSQPLKCYQCYITGCLNVDSLGEQLYHDPEIIIVGTLSLIENVTDKNLPELAPTLLFSKLA